MNPPMLVGSLCSGYGGLELGLELVTPAQPRWFAEIDPAAAKILDHHWPDAPNHGDLTTTDWSGVEPVDVITAGWPCQPWSQAGKRKGSDDERAIWPAVAEALRVVRPRHVFLENVPAIASAGELERVAASLATLGYVGSWRCLRAADVGAPHRRERIFIVAAHPGRRAVQQRPERGRLPAAEGPGEGEGLQRQRRRHKSVHVRAVAPDPGVSGPQGPAGESTPARWADNPGGGAATGRGGATADPEGDGRDTRQPEPAGPQGRPDAALGGSAAAADPDGAGLAGGAERDDEAVGPELETSLGADADGRVLDWGQYGTAIARWECHTGEPAPAPTVLGPRGARRLSPRFVEWLMGLEAGWVCDVPGLTRNQQLKALGNGVVPQQAAAAWRALSVINPLKETA